MDAGKLTPELAPQPLHECLFLNSESVCMPVCVCVPVWRESAFSLVEHAHLEKGLGSSKVQSLACLTSTARLRDIAQTLLWRGGRKSDSDVNQVEIGPGWQMEQECGCGMQNNDPPSTRQDVHILIPGNL